MHISALLAWAHIGIRYGVEEGKVIQSLGTVFEILHLAVTPPSRIREPRSLNATAAKNTSVAGQIVTTDSLPIGLLHARRPTQCLCSGTMIDN